MDAPRGEEYPAAEGFPASEPDSSTINVLVVGETQQGKSTLIKQIGRYAGLRDLDIGIGFGNRSCTTSVNEYKVDIRLQRYTLVDTADGQPFVDETYSELCGLNAHQSRLLPEEVADEDKGKAIPYCFIDTPGLDDSEGRDMEIMAGIMSRVSDFQYINAIVYVRSVEKPFGPSFRDFFQYIQKSMPSISNGIIIAHSSYTTENVRSLRSDDASLERLRRDAFEAATHLDLPHFFMDNDPDPDRPFEVAKSLNESYHLLKFLKAQNALSTNRFQLLKTTAMQSVDAHITNALSMLQHSLERRWDNVKNSADSKEREALRKFRDISSKRALLSSYRDQIAGLRSTEQILLGSRNTEQEFEYIQTIVFMRQLKLEERHFTFDFDYPIAEVKKTVGPGCKWKDEHLRGTSWEGYLSSNRLTNLQGSVTFYTTGTLKHQDKIIHFEKEAARLEGQLEMMEQSFDELKPVTDEDTVVPSLLSLQIEECKGLLTTIDKQTFDMKLYPNLKHIYLLKDRPTRDDIASFIRVYSPDIAELYMIEKPSY